MENKGKKVESQAKVGHKQRFVLFKLTKRNWGHVIDAGFMKKGEANQVVGLLRKHAAGKATDIEVENYVRKWFADWSVSEIRDNPEIPDKDNSKAELEAAKLEITRLLEMLKNNGIAITDLQKQLKETLELVERLKASRKKKPEQPKKGKYIKPNIWDPVVNMIKGGINVLVSGPAGCGKSRMIAEMAVAMDTKYFCISFSGGVRYAQAFGSTQLNGNKSRWEPSQLLKAVQKPGVVLLDEIFAADPEVLLGLNSLLEPDSRSILTPIGEIKVHKDCHFVACANTMGRSKDRQYKGAQRTDDSLLDRFAAVKMDYNGTVERQIIEKMGVDNGDNEVEFLISQLANLRNGVKLHNIPFDPSTRRLITAGKSILSGLDKEQAFAVAFTNSLSKIERGKIGC